MDIIYTHNRAKDNTLDGCIRLTFEICFELRHEAHKFHFIHSHFLSYKRIIFWKKSTHLKCTNNANVY